MREDRPPPTPSRGGAYSPPPPDQVLENVLEHVLQFLTFRRDRNAAALVCRSWHRAEALTRLELFIGNCYAVAPRRAMERFRRATAVTIKGKPRFADFNLMPPDWGANFTPWVTFMAQCYRALEKLCLKRMFVTDEDLELLASFPSFRELVLICCDGFGTSGLAVVASKCRKLRVLDLIEDEVTDDEIDWISCFPEGETCLESLIFDCVECPIYFEALERLVARSPSLKKLKLNRYVSIVQLYRLMIRAPQLTHLGTGSFSPSEIVAQGDQEPDYSSAFDACRSLVCLSGFREIVPDYLPAIYPVCANLTSLNFSYANISAEQLRSVIRYCHKLQIFWVLDTVCDAGLQAVAATCKDLRELRVFPIDAREDSEAPVSDVGLLAISEGCRKLQSILYFCQRMTNAAVIAMSENCPELVVFRLCIMGRHLPDHVTREPMDEGFGAIVKNCKKLTRLATSGLLTDRAFSYIGQYGKLVRTLSVAFAGDSDTGLKYVLEGCPRLQKLEIRDSPFGDSALRTGLHRYYNMRFLWMSSCRLTRRGCKEIAQQMPHLVVEMINGEEEEVKDDYVDTLYMYRSLDGPRADAPSFVTIL
ncbi:Transport inhibitor response 1-like protein [Actinidia chinensis var. chinensis]|uniref:Transport inhibitor response 1-like protein n=1 Tax=Actinidia chinensis var. chinensis TaxID=1590841 RepID=A0A2R6QYE0_ACTCC|nr:Transport inhibitor response 1-like protein [Actinidia chinensis var. chinensis]